MFIKVKIKVTKDIKVKEKGHKDKDLEIQMIIKCTVCTKPLIGHMSRHNR